MKRFIQGEHRGQSALLPESLDDYVADTNPVRVVDVFVDELDLGQLGFDGVVPAETGYKLYRRCVVYKFMIVLCHAYANQRARTHAPKLPTQRFGKELRR